MAFASRVRRRVGWWCLAMALGGAGVSGDAHQQASTQPGATPAPVSADERSLAARMADAADDATRLALLDANVALHTRGLGIAIIEEGQRREAKAPLVAAGMYRAALKLGRTAAEVEIETFALISQGVLDGKQSRYDESLASFVEAEQKASAAHLDTRLSQAIMNQAIVHRRRGDTDLALQCNQRALAIIERSSDETRMAALLNNLGSLALDVGDFRLALDYFVRSLAIKDRLEIPDAITVINLGVVSERQGDAEQAIAYYRRGLETAEALNDNDGIVAALNDLGHVSVNRKQFDEALVWFRRGLALAERNNMTWLQSRLVFNLASVLHGQGKALEALEQYRQSLAMREKINDRIGAVESRSEIARVLTELQRLPEAVESARLAVASARDGGNLPQLWVAQAVLGRSLEASGDVAGAERAYRDSISTIESLRDLVAGGAEQRQQFFETKQDPYEHLVALLAAAHRDADALSVSEGAKARALLDVLQGSTELTRAMTDQERDQERQLRRAVTLARTDLASARNRPPQDTAAVARFDARLQAARRALSEFQARLFAVHPSLRVLRGDLAVVSAADLADLLPSPQSVALEFKVTTTRTFVFLVSRDRSGAATVTVRAIPISRDQLTAQTRDFHQRLATRDFDVQTLSRRLYETLIGPVQTALASASDLVIIPDGPLWELPFQALQSASGRYLIERVAVSYAPSLSALREMRKVGQTRGASSSRLAMTGFGSAGLPPTAKADPSLAGLPPLVEAESQAVAIGKIYGPTRSQVFVGDAARQPRLATDAGHSRIVHVAAHAVLDDASPLHSFLLFSRKPNEPPDAGRVEAADLMRLDLSAELVVLSACDTGRGRVGEGEGLIGMSWSLFVAGAPSVVVSQWKVDSVSTTALMVDFHGRLNQYLISHGRVGQRAQALRQAALAMLKSGSYAHPFYWAPFVVVGDGL